MYILKGPPTSEARTFCWAQPHDRYSRSVFDHIRFIQSTYVLFGDVRFIRVLQERRFISCLRISSALRDLDDCQDGMEKQWANCDLSFVLQLLFPHTCVLLRPRTLFIQVRTFDSSPTCMLYSGMYVY
jgi:hypothetical protein